jgi:hypothetical protein
MTHMQVVAHIFNIYINIGKFQLVLLFTSMESIITLVSKKHV